MPTVQTIVSILKKAGLSESEIIRAETGRAANNSRGFRVHASPVERRVVHVYHIGKGVRAGLNNYAAALAAAGYIVGKAKGGLKVTSRRAISDRGKDITVATDK